MSMCEYAIGLSESSPCLSRPLRGRHNTSWKPVDRWKPIEPGAQQEGGCKLVHARWRRRLVEVRLNVDDS
jgi:hypothetical protein